MTFVSARDGWVLGTSAGALSILRTADAGHTWTRLAAPPARLASDNAGGISELRFADPQDGWAFDPDLWATHDGGGSWHQIVLPGIASGASVSSLEAATGLVHAAVNSGTGGVRVETSPVGADSWRLSPTTVVLGAGPVPAPQLVLQGTSGWLVEVDRTVTGGARISNGQWVPWQPPCLQVNGPMTLAASDAQDLLAVCDQGVWGPASPTGVREYVSSDGGSAFRQLATAVPSAGGGVGSLASPSPGVAVLADGSELLATFDGGANWSDVYQEYGMSVRYVGFETATQGVAIVDDQAGAQPFGNLLMTFDGGHHWAHASF